MLTLSRHWNPWKQFNRLQAELDQAFHQLGTPSWEQTSPALQIWENGDAVLIAVQAPGYELSELDVNVQKEVVTISGHHQASESQDDNEKASNGFNRSFSRTIRLPFAVEAHSTEARYEKGILFVKLSRPEEEKPFKVAIHGA